MKRFVLFFFLFHFYLFVFSQSDFKPGYIININEDTVSGLIDFRSDVFNAKYCVFKTNANAEAIEYAPGDIQAYQFNDSKFYTSHELELDGKKQLIFIELLVDGRASLYFLPPESYYIQLPGEELVLLENTARTSQIIPSESAFDLYKDEAKYESYKKEYIGTLRIHMKDCPEIWDRINYVNLEQSSLIKITTKYHDLVCPDEECTVYSKAEKTLEPRIGIYAGTDIHLMELWLGSVLGAAGTYTGYLIGLSMDFKFLGKSERFYPILDVGFSQVDYEGSGKWLFSIKNKNLFFGASLNYIYPRYKLQPYAGIGLKYYTVLNDRNSYIFRETNSFVPIRQLWGLSTNLGIVYDVNKTLKFKVQTDYLKPIRTVYADGFITAKLEPIKIAASVMFAF